MYNVASCVVRTDEAGYNDISLSDTLSITSDFLWCQLIPHRYSPRATTHVYKDTKYSVRFMTL